MTSRQLADAYQLARNRLIKETGKSIYKRANILKAVEEHTGIPLNQDVREYLLAYARYTKPEISGARRAYTPDRSMTIAAKRAAIQPELMSMNSNVKYWNNENE
jgi:predicted solute-binding protein